MRCLVKGLIAFSVVLVSQTVSASQTLSALAVLDPPEIDGIGSDAAWQHAQTVTTQDAVADIQVELQAVHDGKNLYMKVRFPDETESIEHKSLVWNRETELYEIGPKREDVFVIKWNMQLSAIDLSLSADQDYKADIWYWKAHRTDKLGYADDKYQIYSSKPLKKSWRLMSKSGRIFYLKRKGDKGKPSYKSMIAVDYLGDEIPGIKNQKPQGSRADVRAKGIWKDGFWTVEFSRALSTGNSDDIALTQGVSAQFGVSRYEIAGHKKNPKIDTPLYGSGEVGEALYLKLQ